MSALNAMQKQVVFFLIMNKGKFTIEELAEKSGIQTNQRLADPLAPLRKNLDQLVEMNLIEDIITDKPRYFITPD
jgi:hypothetical protein